MNGEARSTTTSTSDIAQAQTQEQQGSTDLTGRAADTAQQQALLDEEESGRFRSRWDEIQTSFVDEPRRSVEQADSLVAEVMQHIAANFARTRSDLEGRWSGGGEVGTEELRVALRQYRSFFELLLRR